MTKAKNFYDVFAQLKTTLKNGEGFGTKKDCNVMADLGFTPQSWTRWGPKLREMCFNQLFTSEEHKEGWIYETESYKIIYNKKFKIWKLEYQPLYKKRMDEDEMSTPLTDEDYKKLGLLKTYYWLI